MAASNSVEPNGILRRNSQLQMWATIVLAFIAVGGVFWSFSGRIERHENMIQDIKNQAQLSISDRHNLAKLVEDNRKDIYDIRREMAADKSLRDAELKEQETQFASTENKINANQAEQHRLNAIMWNKIGTLGEYPSSPYFFSNISQHNR